MDPQTHQELVKGFRPVFKALAATKHQEDPSGSQQQAQVLSSYLKSLDLNSDGFITPAELQAAFGGADGNTSTPDLS